ncbi:hypothetical protein GPECTOR_2g1030 [Gonium pectorale]|uniref:Armadillo repeat-containing protein 8 n=1 Tax=Gonium pectorale TaxID=33097 RepID=A0A150H068_GONPE|nr:hypothetical protein GPECTOR_2g1030 [Gonium pectorale]|eukprot:KXZ55481.1 hypothetical protein GPECTOR_2g1030 [Gonium pectorale]
MPSSEKTVEKSVEDRLGKARLLNRISAEVLTMCKSVDKLLHAQHTSNLAHAVVCVQEIARENFAVVIALKWVVLLVDMLESDTPDVRLAACNALTAVSVVQEGRDAVRSCGGLRPLVMLLAEGSRSPIAAAAGAVLMNCSACDVCKVAIADCRGVPMLLGLVRDAVSRCNPGGGGASSSGVPPPGAGNGSPGGSGGGGAHDLRTPGDCKAAAYAAGALMNMGGVTSVQEMMVQAGAVPLFETVTRIAQPGDVVSTRVNFVLSWLAVGTGSGLDLADAADAESEAGPAQDARRASGPGHGSVRTSGNGLTPPHGAAHARHLQSQLTSNTHVKVSGSGAAAAAALSRQVLGSPAPKSVTSSPAGKTAMVAGNA